MLGGADNIPLKTCFISLNSNLLPKIGVDMVSERDTVEGRPAMMHTMASKKLEWGATAKMGASPLLTFLPLTTTRKPRLKKYIRPRKAITVRHRNLRCECAC